MATNYMANANPWITPEQQAAYNSYWSGFENLTPSQIDSLFTAALMGNGNPAANKEQAARIDAIKKSKFDPNAPRNGFGPPKPQPIVTPSIVDQQAQNFDLRNQVQNVSSGQGQLAGSPGFKPGSLQDPTLGGSGYAGGNPNFQQSQQVFGGTGGVNAGLSGYGLSQQVGGIGHGFGIPGFENNPMTATGGSWAGTSWMPPGPSTLVQNPILESDWSNPNSPNYIPPYQAGDINTDGGTTPGFKINPAIPYQTTWNQQTYSGKPAPFLNIHEQMGQALQGIPTATPGYGWASPQALAQLGGYGLPGGWTSMLGFTPGGSK